MRPLLSCTALCSVIALSLAGCSAVTAPTGSTSPAAGLQGKVFGGQQPVTGAVIQLYAVNTTTDGGASTPLLTTTVTTSDGSGLANSNANSGNSNNTLDAGYFNITNDYSCAGNPTVFLTATGGNPGLAAGTNNTSIQMVAALGSCTNLQTNVQFLSINELTTVAAVTALYPYMTSYNAIGSTPANASALTAAFNLANEYVNFQNGQAPGPALPNGYYASTNDLNALANVLASCVNTVGGTYNDGSACGTLYADAKPTGAPTNPATVVDALIAIRNNPTHNVPTIFFLQPPVSPFQPVNASAPPDFTLPIVVIPGTPAFSPSGGTYTSAQSVTISDSDASAVIYYTTDGSTPTTSSSVYSAPVNVGSTETLQAFAVESSRASSAVGSAAYTINLPNVPPTVSVSTVTSTFGSTTPATVTATETGSSGVANGSVVTFSITGAADGTFNPATCTIHNGSCSATYRPSGTLAAGTYSGVVSASFAQSSPYSAATATGDLVINTAPTFTAGLLASLSTVTGQGPAYGNLVQASDGNFYGSAFLGGSASAGSIFKVTPGGAVTSIHSFPYNMTTDGYDPYGSLFQASDGMLYGTTVSGGPGGYGVVYKIDLTGATYTLLHGFTLSADGASPYAGVIEGTDGRIYGTASGGGAIAYGVVFSMKKDGTDFQVLHTFTGGTTDGGRPYGRLVEGADGLFYGTTNTGGANGTYGTVYSVSAAGTFTLVHSFSTAATDGKTPWAGLFQGLDGLFYGTTVNGGANNFGAIFSIDSTGATFNLLHSSATGAGDMRQPFANLYQGSDGVFYGTGFAGATTYGAAFSITASGTFQQLHAYISGATDGYRSKDGLIQGNDGVLYGLTTSGGANGTGAITKLTGSPALAPPVVLVVPASVPSNNPFTLGWSVANAGSNTYKNCFATNNAGDTTDWVGPQYGTPQVSNITLIAPGTPGAYTYTLTCGGTETGLVTLNVF